MPHHFSWKKAMLWTVLTIAWFTTFGMTFLTVMLFQVNVIMQMKVSSQYPFVMGIILIIGDFMLSIAVAMMVTGQIASAFGEKK